jgi:hypothetical protein
VATGTTTIDFGTATQKPGDIRKTITGQDDILAGSLVEAWVRAEASVDHTSDEHMIEALKVEAGNIVEGVGFDIVATCTLGSTYGLWHVNWAWI